MPWDHTTLWVADYHEGIIINTRCLAGEDVQASITQPRWSPDGTLYWISDQSEYWQLYRLRNNKPEHFNLSGLENAEFAYADWFQGSASYAFLSKEMMVACYNHSDRWTVIRANLINKDWSDLTCPIVEIIGNAVKPVSETSFAMIGSTYHSPIAVSRIDINEGGLGIILSKSSSVTLPEDFVPIPQSITFPRIHGPGDGEAHGFLYLPRNPNFKAPEGTLPPLIVAAHGGPTFAEGTGFSMRDMALVTRGYALVQVNYVGSTGNGRRYRNALGGQWGVSDVADCVSAVNYLANEGLIDRNRVGITGHSAGGYVTMQAMATFPKVWKCGVAESGISDMSLLIEETHKFESKYDEPLCYPEGTPLSQKVAILKERSPITHAADIAAPILIINGAGDAIVPPNQARQLAKKIEGTGTPVELVIYEGEGHIFSKGSTLEDIERRRYAWFEKYLAV
jgi:dipeptidyl aminopeptidase/acylaminoacyl peptidase